MSPEKLEDTPAGILLIFAVAIALFIGANYGAYKLVRWWVASIAREVSDRKEIQAECIILKGD